MSSTLMWRSLCGVLVVASCAVGCTVHATTSPDPEPVSYTEVTAATVPADVTVYPSTAYEGHTVYYVNNRWVYHDGNRWVGYRNEPPTLVRYRSHVQSAPPARRGYEQPAPANNREREEQHQEAPPARRVD